MNKTETKELIEVQFKKVDRHISIVLFTILGILLPISVINSKSDTEIWPINIAIALSLVGMFIYTIQFAVIHKKRICLEHDLVCPHCGQTPKAGLAISSLESDTCFRCKKTMTLK